MKRHLICITLVACSTFAWGARPTAKTVSWVASNPLIPHDVISGEPTTLKGTSDLEGANIEYTWNFGDGSDPETGTVTDKYNVSATHTYTGDNGSIFTATLTLRDTDTNESSAANYFVQIREDTLEVRAHIAIDKGLWYLHTTQRRDALFEGSGDWIQGGSASNSNYANTAAALLAFQVVAHRENGSPDDPYTETVSRGAKALFTFLTTHEIADQPLGDPDANGNGYGVLVNQADPYYQGGLFIDAIVASGNPNAVTTTGNEAAGADPGIKGRTYKDIVQDMLDEYNWAQYDGDEGGGWRYSANQFPDNSANQWAAIGYVAAERNFGCTVPQWVKDHTKIFLTTSQQVEGDGSPGVFGYTGKSPIWGPYATTGAGMVQMAWLGIGRGDAQWDRTESFMHDQLPDTEDANSSTNEILDNYYGLFSFTKSMLLHDANGDGVAEPVDLLGGDLDWYAAEVSKGDPTDGVARTLVKDQEDDGHWSGHHDQGGLAKWSLETASAIVMLNRTVFESGLPVAVASANPSPAVTGGTVTLDGSRSFHQDASRRIVRWEWDIDNDGTYDLEGVTATTSYPALGDYPVVLRVTDDANPAKQDTTVVVVEVALPPLAPTANAAGPYVLCPQTAPWVLDASASTNPDEGLSEEGQPGSTIQEYAWELDGDNDFDDAFGVQPDVTEFYTNLGPGAYIIQVRVTDTTSTSFPSSGLDDLSSTASTALRILEEDDLECVCGEELRLVARAQRGRNILTWDGCGADHYNIYRAISEEGPFFFLDASPVDSYADESVDAGVNYCYFIRPADESNREVFQSNQACVSLGIVRCRVMRSTNPKRLVQHSGRGIPEGRTIHTPGRGR